MTQKISNLGRYEADLDRLIDRAVWLQRGLCLKCDPEETVRVVKKAKGEEAESHLKKFPNFDREYQSWYSEAKVLIKQLLPDRLSDFASHYEKPKNRKDITYESYRIEDALQGLNVTSTRGLETKKVVGMDAAIPHFQQQQAILTSVKERFRSSLFDIKQLVQADLFDSEIEAAEELANKKFLRAAGAISGVVIERHLSQVCENHHVKITKKYPSVADFNDALKSAGVIDMPQWRSIQLLADIRNLCDHDKKKEPTSEQINDLVAGTKKLIKTLF